MTTQPKPSDPTTPGTARAARVDESLTSDALSRRRFLTKVTGGAAGALVLAHPVGRAAGALGPGRPHSAGGAGAFQVARTAAGQLTLVRAADQLHLTTGLIDAEVSGAQVVPTGPSAALRFTIGSQHAAEEAVNLTAGNPPPPATQAMRRQGAGDSRVVVALTDPVPFTVVGLLGALAGDLRLDPRASQGGTGSGAPSVNVTAIEVPADVVLSPGPGVVFEPNGEPVTIEATTELWRLRLGTVADETWREASAAAPLEARAIWGGAQNDAFPRPLTKALRSALVASTTGPAGVPLDVDRLRLSLHGADADLSGAWGGTLAAYQEMIRSGATVTSTVVQRGAMAPFGTGASFLEVTERRFEVAADGSTVAVLDTYQELALSGGPATYPTPLMPDNGRGLPFVSVATRDAGVPLEAQPVTWTDTSGAQQSIAPDLVFGFRDAATGEEIRFEHVAVDRAGNEIVFTHPMFFVTDAVAYQPGSVAMALLEQLYDDAANAGASNIGHFARMRIVLDRQGVAYADEVEPGSGATTKQTHEMLLRLPRLLGKSESTLRDAGQMANAPAMAWARIGEPTIVEFAGAGATMANQPVQLDPDWLAHGLGAANTGAAFLSLRVGGPGGGLTKIDFSASQGAGVLAPRMEFDTFSQALPFVSKAVLNDGTWNPLAELTGTRLLGLIPLDAILESIDLDGLSLPELPQVPGLPRFRSVNLPDEICQTYRWEPELRTWSVANTPVFVVAEDLAANGLINPFDGDAAALLELTACVGVANEAPPRLSTEVSLRNVVVQVPPALPALALQVRELRWSAGDDDPGGVDLDIAGYQFVGMLQVLEPFRNILRSSGSGPTLDIDPQRGVDAEVRINPPDITLGIVNITNLWASLGVYLPFGQFAPPGSPAPPEPFHATFNIGSKPDPVAISVLGFKGAASFAMKLRPPPEGMVRFFASLSVGVEISAGGFGVSGSVGIELGASIEYLADEDEIFIGGTFRIHGRITVFAVVELSVEAFLELIYQVNNQILDARGTITGRVDTPLASGEFTLQVTEQFELGGGSEGGAPAGLQAPSGRSGATPPGTDGFADLYDADSWATYCAAFA